VAHSPSTDSQASGAGPSPKAGPGVLQTLRAGINAAGLCGLFFGLADGLVAAVRGAGSGLGALKLAGCILASVVPYTIAFLVVLPVLGLVLHPFLRSRSLARRYDLLLAFGFGGGLFFELYWWTRPFVFYGRSSVAPERLAAAAGMCAVGIVLGFVAVRLLARLPKPAKFALPFVLYGAWIGGGVFLLAQRAPTARGTINERNRNLPNVLLVIVDALRDDVLGPYGNDKVKTPVIDGLAQRGVVFENVLAQAPFTWTSFGSFFTGKYPLRHGLVKMEAGVRMSPNVTIPWHLKSARFKDGSGALQDGDFYGATFMTGALSNGSGLMRGFDAYFEAMYGHELVELDNPWSVFRSKLLLFQVKNKLTQRFDHSLVVTTARSWLREYADRRFVTLVHLYSTHTPYDPELEFRDLYCDPAYDGPVESFYAYHREMIESGQAEPTAADIEQIRNLYYAGVTQADRDIGIVLRELDRLGALDNTLVIVTSDHGESLGEQDLWEHNHMVQTNLRIPLIMSWPGGLPEGVRVSAMVESVDLLPTICDLFGLELPADDEPEGRGLVDGVSLMPLIRGEVERVKDHSYATHGTFISVQGMRWKLVVPHKPKEGSWESAARDAGRLFDLEQDPAEDHNLFTLDHPEALRLFELLKKHDEEMPTPQHLLVPSRRDEEALLDGLGYTGGVGMEGSAEDEPESDEEEDR
jgi:arylsulfatase A-like enzyme